MTLRVPKAVIDAIKAHGRSAYPEEGCGYLIGIPGEPRRVDEARPARNVAPDLRERRYDVDPRDTLRVGAELRGTGREILGFFHSHPDHAARPSPFDLERAWDWYTYVVVAVEKGRPVDLRAWRLAEGEGQRSFKEEELEVV